MWAETAQNLNNNKAPVLLFPMEKCYSISCKEPYMTLLLGLQVTKFLNESSNLSSLFIGDKHVLQSSIEIDAGSAGTLDPRGATIKENQSSSAIVVRPASSYF
ncbi:hypothetical protein KL934_002655 [Ogataea polymorpha]|nr:hypothetical protein KL934_002655 [Ogataea polymorpha]